jgi:hypothetical protein
MDNRIKLAGVSLVSAGIGFVVGYKVLEKSLEARFDERLQEETAGMREFYTAAKKPYATPEEAVKDLIPPSGTDPRVGNEKTQYHKVVATEGYDGEESPLRKIVAGESIPVVQNVFDDKPTIITQDVFMINEPGHEQATLTYYVKSDQVCGEREEPIDNADIVVGTEFKENFGKDSSDPNVVHIRNIGLHMDFEVLRSEGSYEEEVLGQVGTDSSVPPHKRVRFEGR